MNIDRAVPARFLGDTDFPACALNSCLLLANL